MKALPSSAALSYALRYKLRQSAIGIGIFFAFFVGLGVLVPVIIIVALQQTGASGTGGSTDVMLTAMVFVGIIACIASYVDFKFFIQNGFSRARIFWVNIAATAITSLFTALVMTAIAIIINNLIPSVYTVGIVFATSYVYGGFGVLAPTSHFLAVSLLSFLMLFFAGSLGLVIGIFLDKAGTTVRLVVFAGAIILVSALGVLFQFIPDGSKAFLGRLVGFGANGRMTAWPFALTLVVVSALLCGGTYLLSRHREVKRVNA
jgi:hypothetical protein